MFKLFNEINKQNPDVEKIKRLLKDKRVDPSCLNNCAIKRASKRGHENIVKLLIKDERVRDQMLREKLSEVC
jgi:hypothetical protein